MVGTKYALRLAGWAALAAIMAMPRPAAAQQSTTSQPSAATPVFTRDVAPILQDKCQACHRPGYIAPMAFLTSITVVQPLPSTLVDSEPAELAPGKTFPAPSLLRCGIGPVGVPGSSGLPSVTVEPAGGTNSNTDSSGTLKLTSVKPTWIAGVLASLAKT